MSYRYLLPSEIAEGKKIFGETGIDWEKVRIYDIKYPENYGTQGDGDIMTPNGNIYIPPAHDEGQFYYDIGFADPYNLDSRALLIHELAHVWQESHYLPGGFVPDIIKQFSKEFFGGVDRYNYDAIFGNTLFKNLPLEAQAHFLADLYKLRELGVGFLLNGRNLAAYEAKLPSDFLNSTFGPFKHHGATTGLPLRSHSPDWAGSDSISDFVREMAIAMAAMPWRRADPLVLDLTGAGITLSSMTSSHAYFNLEERGFATLNGWTTGDNNGLLAIDANDNGVIDNLSELFGNADQSGFEELAELDSNNDDKITSADTQWGDLRVWVDANSDGLTDNGELHTLAELGITEIGLTTSEDGSDINGNTLVETANFVMGGNNRTIGEVLFSVNSTNSVYAGDLTEISFETLLLPFLRGAGIVADTTIAMSLDGTLLTMGQSLAAEANLGNFDTLRADMQDFMFRWAGVDGVDPDSRDADLFGGDARKLEFMENYTGVPFETPWDVEDPDSAIQWVHVHEAFDHALQTFMAKFLVQSDANLQSVARYETTTDSIVLLTLDTEDFVVAEPTDANSAALYWAVLAMAETPATAADLAIKDFILSELRGEYANLTTEQKELFNVAAGDHVGPIVSWYDGRIDVLAHFRPAIVLGGNAGADARNEYDIQQAPGRVVFWGGAGDDYSVASGAAVSNLFIGGEGNDHFNGRAGAENTYYFRPGDGQDTIECGNAAGLDRVIFAEGIAPEDVTYTRVNDGTDLLVTIGVGGDSITIVSYFAPGTGGERFYGGIDEFIFADDTVHTAEYARSQAIVFEGVDWGGDVLSGSEFGETISGLEGHDTISGYEGNDVIYGGDGSEFAFGGDGNDIIYGEGDADTFLGGDDGDDTIYGGAGNDSLGGGDGEDILDGGTGADAMTGGTGNDIYVIDDASDIATEWSDEGIDTVQSSVSFTLDSNIENLTLTGSSAINGTGNSLDNILTGNSGVNTLTGGDGDDTYVIGASDVVVENSSEGSDTINIGSTYTLGSNLENLTLIGSSNINGTGNTLDNVLIGNSGTNTLTGSSGNDTLDGGTGTDALIGGTGDDIYIVDSTGDTITENSSEGTDTVQSSVTFSISAISNVENVTLTGSSNINGTGNTLNNVLTGNGGNNTLDGGAGTDTLVGGTGDDTYVVDSATDTITENSSEGTDTVQSGATITLASNVENLTLTGSSGINGTGNTLANVITGNSGNNTLTGGDGNDTLDGGAGTDTLVGGADNDTYIVDSATDTITEGSSAGTDTVLSSATITLTTNVENLTLTGSSNINGTGNTLDNVLIGNSGTNTLTGSSGNDTLDGGTGTDTLIGGTGDDVYIVDSTGDTITENSSEGTDTVQSSVTFSISAISNVENITLTGSSAINATGNTSVNVLTGNSGANTLDGGAGADTLIGGAGNDVYVVDDASDVVTEGSNEGTDLVNASVTTTLGSNVENLTLTGSSNINGTGNTLANIITGNTGVNTLTGGSGNDTLDGGTGADTLIGGTGDDVYVVDNAGDVVTENSSEGTDTVNSGLTYALGSNLENVTLTGSSAINATGNTLDNILTGNSGVNTLTGSSGNDTLDGGAGADTLIGGTGDDIFVVDNTSDVVTENSSEGTDRINSSVTYTASSNVENMTLTGSSNVNATGNTQNNILIGNSGNNSLDGGSGTDTLTGGLGDDTYVVDSTGDLITENVDEGSDTVLSSATFTMAAIDNVENLTLSGSSNINGTGNDLDNAITGNSGVNTLTGNDGDDTLDGASGADTLIGGAGDDIYVVDDAGDVVTESSDEGVDTVSSSIAYTLGSNLENVTLTGSSNINGTGNSLDNVITGNTGVNTLSGSSGNDTLDGDTGADTLIGGTGDDFYIVDNTSDVVTESSNEGTDYIYSSVTYTLSSNVEGMTLTGSSAINGTGNSLDNILIGNNEANTLTGSSGNDTLDGGGDADTLIGGTGDDIYYVDNTSDVVTEGSSEGTDIVYSNVTHTLGSNVEYLTLTGSSEIDGTGNTLDNILIGNSAVNTLTGSSGNDTLDGRSGADTLIGGTGDDIFIVDNVGDVITEDSSEGTDSVFARVNYTLSSDVENLTLTGFLNINGTGNALNNVLTGNTSNNTLTGGDGDDTYYVDSLLDVVVENADEGIDTVYSSVSFNLGNSENLYLTGSADIDGTGNSDDNILMGNSGINTLIGGDGNDTYSVNTIYDIVTEDADEGIDTVYSDIAWTLGSNLEYLILTGSSNIAGTGNSLDNILISNGGINGLAGLDGDDTYSFAAGGGDGSTVSESLSEGFDTILIHEVDPENVIMWTDYFGVLTIKYDSTNQITVGGGGGGFNPNAIGDYVEQIVFDDTTVWDLTGSLNLYNPDGGYLMGTDYNDTLRASASTVSYLYGYDGNDTIIGGGTNSSLNGGDGADTFVFESATAYNAIDTLGDFSTGDADVIDISDLMSAYTPGVSTLSDFVQAVNNGFGDSNLQVDRDGTAGGYGFQTVALISGVASINVGTYVSNGNLVVA
jgi:Ca2+-binding RTX toxin-like protein